MKVLQISDTHHLIEYKDALDKWGVNYNPTEILKKFLSNYNFQEIDFVVHTGDIIHDGNKQDYHSFDDLLSTYIPDDIPVYYCLGNHDKKDEFKTAFNFQSDLENLYVHLKIIGDRIFIFLDTATEEFHHGYISKEQMDWLQELLEKYSGKNIYIFQHHPLEISWIKGIEQTEIPEGYIEMLQKYNVKGIFTGHLHMNRNYQIGSIPQYTANSFVFGMTREGKEIWNTNRLGFNEIEIGENRIDVFSEIINPMYTKFNQNIL